MDEVFWTNVVKRWSDASENVIILKKELLKVQEERDLFRSLVQSRRRSDTSEAPRHHEGAHVFTDSKHLDYDESAIQDELEDAEAGLLRAKEEYRRLQHELGNALKTIESLKAENESTKSRYEQDMANLKEEMRQYRLDSNKFASEHYAPIQPHTPGNGMDRVLRELEESKEQVEILQRAVREREESNVILRDELAVTAEKLHKVEESNKALLSTIVKLQNIARHSTVGLLHSISNTLLKPESRRPSRKPSFASTYHHTEKDSEHANGLQVSPKGIQNEEDPLVSQRCPLPLRRQQAFAELPSIHVPSINPAENIFERGVLKTALADNMQALTEYLPSNYQDKDTLPASYLCPTLNHHPWCPAEVGENGYIFVGLGKEKDAYASPVIRNLFVGLPKDRSRSRCFRYLGKYKVMRAEPLSLEEWNTLSNEAKVMFANLTKEKTKDDRPVDDILQAYNEGTLVVPCVQLQFMSFDSQFYTSLITLARQLT